MPTSLPTAFLSRYGPRALILGGSEGIGLAFANQLAAAGFHLTLAARSAATLEQAAEAIRSDYQVDVQAISLDLTSAGIEVRAREIIAGGEYGLVVYNAGATHGVGLFLDQPADRALNLVRLNCTTPTAFAHHALAAMRARRRGGLILVSSMSGLVGSGYVAAYAAAKSFEIVLAEGLHWELARDGVDVMCAVATLTDTPAMRRSGMVEVEGLTPMEAGDFADGALRALGTAPVWYAAGDAAVSAVRSTPRPAATAQASLTSAQLWGITPLA
ncbi:SDR family NAD(P)-dependent oxidoreductase [Novosphingobium sp. Chol11]|uniref:SDR family NAD(P)-dependent oxidoreductase n=1 Tax=Novosphingobium sp. Chol11 TaxID=1385763 RepID=UPI0015966DCD|nr:SDR family NAD(P)-dependent oxidoreductase [Novosphingobium sp. Chol11]